MTGPGLAPPLVRGGGHRPLRLDQPGVAYQLTEGWADVFAEMPEAGALPRQLFRIEAGGVLFGVDTGPDHRLLARGSPSSLFTALPAGAAVGPELDQWMGRFAGLAGAAEGWPDLVLDAVTLTLPPGTRGAPPPNRLIWVIVEGGALLRGQTPLPEMPWPLIGPDWIEAPEGCTVRPVPPPSPDRQLAACQLLCRLALARLATLTDAAQQAKPRLVLRAAALGQARLDAALAALAGAASGAKEVGTGAAFLPGDPMAAAFVLLCHVGGHARALPAEWPVSMADEAPAARLARFLAAAQVAMRDQVRC